MSRWNANKKEVNGLKRLKSRAQIAMEYLIIIGFVAVITLPLVVIFQTHSRETSEDITATQVYQISKRIADAAETVYYLGEPSRVTLKAYFPSEINSIVLGNNEIVFKVKRGRLIDEIVVNAPYRNDIFIENEVFFKIV